MNINVLASGLKFPEGPFLTADGRLVVTEIDGGRLTQVDMDGTTSLFADTGGGPNGAALAPDGSVYLCNNGGQIAAGSASASGGQAGSVQRVTADGTVATLLSEVDGRALFGPNDCVFDADGGFWFTNPDPKGQPGTVCYLSPDGKATTVAEGLRFPNGIGISPDGKFLVVCESMTGSLHSFPIEGPGKVGAGRINGNIGRRSIPDGFCLDSEGHIIVAGFQTKNLFVLDVTDGRPVEIVQLPDAGPTNACFGGPDFKTLFVTSSRAGQVLSIDWPVPGMKLAN